MTPEEAKAKLADLILADEDVYTWGWRDGSGCVRLGIDGMVTVPQDVWDALGWPEPKS